MIGTDMQPACSSLHSEMSRESLESWRYVCEQHKSVDEKKHRFVYRNRKISYVCLKPPICILSLQQLGN